MLYIISSIVSPTMADRLMSEPLPTGTLLVYRVPNGAERPKDGDRELAVVKFVRLAMLYAWHEGAAWAFCDRAPESKP